MSAHKVVIDTGKLGSPKFLSQEQRVAFELHEFDGLEKKCYSTSDVTCHGYRWNLQVYPWGETDAAKAQEMTSIYLRCKRISSDQAWSKVKFTTRAGGKCHFGKAQFTRDGPSWGNDRFAKRSELVSKLDSSGTLTVHVDMSIWTEKQPLWYPQKSLQHKMEMLLHDDKHADVTFMLPGGCHVSAHHLVLKIQSPTLSDFAEETRDGKVDIEHVNPDLFAGMIRFMYTNSLPNGFDLKKDGIELLKLANTFGCSDLKMFMEAKIIEFSDLLSLENAAEMLLLADANDSALLKEAAMDLVISNPAKIMQTDGWKNLQESRSLLEEAFAGFSKAVQPRMVPTNSNDEPEKLSVSALRKRLSDANLDADGTRETLVKRLKKEAAASGN